jgi:uncharacterized protein involved in exopolysaccharide biosynthesis
MMTNPAHALERRDAVRLRDVYSKLAAGRYWILAITVLSMAAFAAAAFLIVPVYRAATVLVPASTDRSNLGNALTSALGQLGGLASIAGVNVGASDLATEEALAVLRSRQFTERFISEENLLPRLFADQWDAGSLKWKGRPKDEPTLSRAYRRFSRSIFLVTQDKKTGLVTLQIDWTNADEAAQWANELIERINAEMRSRAIAKAEASTEFLEKELASPAAVETHMAESRLMETVMEKKMLANITSEYAFRVIDKAMRPSRDEPIRPKKLLLLLAGPLVGLVLGIGLVLGFGTLRELW